MKGKRKKANNVINRPKRYVKGTQNSTKLLIFCPSIITHQFIGGNYDETFN